jgi:hypothetical protein
MEFIAIGIVALDFDDLGDEAPAGPAFEVHDDVHGITDIRLHGAKAKVSPATTMATRESPRAIVLVKACWSTLTAFSQGEDACAKTGTASRRLMAVIHALRDAARNRMT